MSGHVYKILITGDFYGGGRVKELIEKNDHEKLFSDFLDTIKAVDLAITNLEAPLIEPPKANEIKLIKTGPNLYASPRTAKILHNAGFNLITLANNHILDYGKKGLENTLSVLKENNIGFIGAGLNSSTVREPLSKRIDNFKLAIINICENEWSTVADYNYGANPFHPLRNLIDIKKAKETSDLVVVIFHGGNEHFNLPGPEFRQNCQFLIEAGADYVVCHHSHTYSGYEKYKHGYIFYGLGNFIFDDERYRSKPWNFGFALQLNYSKRKTHFELIPYKQNDSVAGISNLSESEASMFKDKILELNSIISDKEQLDKYYKEYCKKTKKQYLTYLQPYGGKYLQGAYKRGLLPSLFNEKKYLLLQNLIRCESHRSALITVLQNQLKK